MSIRRNIVELEEEAEVTASVLEARSWAVGVMRIVAFAAGAVAGVAFASELLQWKVPTAIAQVVGASRLAFLAPRLALGALPSETTAMATATAMNPLSEGPVQPAPSACEDEHQPTATHSPAPSPAPSNDRWVDRSVSVDPSVGYASMIDPRPVNENHPKPARRISRALRGFVWSPERQSLVPAIAAAVRP